MQFPLSDIVSAQKYIKQKKIIQFQWSSTLSAQIRILWLAMCVLLH